MAIVFVNRFGGRGPGWCALALGAIPVTWAHFARAGAFELGATTIVVLYLILGTILNVVMQSERTARQKAEQNALTASRQAELLEKEIAERKTIEQELRRAEASLRARETDLRDHQEELLLALDAARMGTWSLNLSNREVTWSPIAEAMLGYAPGEFPGGFESFVAMVHPEDRADIIDSISSRLTDRPQQHSHQFRVVWPDGSIHWLESKGKPFFDAGGKPIRMIGVTMDITERKEAESKLRTRESQLSGILNNASAAIYLKDADGRYLLTNRRHDELCSPDGESVVGKTTEEVFPESLARAFRAADEKVWQTQTPLDCEEFANHPDGLHTYRSVKFPVTDETGKMVALGGISTDISDLKEAHEALKAEQALLRNLIQVQENERKLVCFDIHDGMIQSVAGSMMLLEGYGQSQPAADGSAVITDVIQNLRLAVNEGRRVIRGVRSTVLDEVGLVLAILDLVDHMSDSELAIEFVHDGDFSRLPKNVETAVYRVTQEALTNARKHSGSQRVRIELTLCDDTVRVEIRDYGCGFNVKTSRHDALGILGMTERMRLLGGQCTIHSEIGTGTQVAAWLQVDPSER
jgi:PAS domain S-box-containing protein